jgi:hypothetical protein
MKLTTQEYHTLYTLVFNPANNYPGYQPGVLESPDGNATWDTKKHYAHIALKYLDNYKGEGAVHMRLVLEEWTQYATEVAIDLGLPMKYWPHINDSTIRILAYRPGAESALHTDFDLFTLPMYRNIVSTYEANFENGSVNFLSEDTFNRLHYGELMEEINPMAYKATPHKVTPDFTGRTQYAAVFFAMPRLDVQLPCTKPVYEWLRERKGRSRKSAA